MADAPFGMGRRFELEPAMDRYALRDLLPRRLTRAPRQMWIPRGGPLDQGDTGECVGYGFKNWLLAPPVRDARTSPPSAVDIYRGACVSDEWPENDAFDPQAGTSVRGALKWMLAQGHIGAYHWSTNADDVFDYLTGLDAHGRPAGGPLVIGVSWYESMFDVDGGGHLHISGKVAGGHCVALVGGDNAGGVVLGQCAWGTQFGIKDARGRGTSRFWLSGEDLQRLLSEQGEAAAAAEVRVKAA